MIMRRIVVPAIAAAAVLWAPAFAQDAAEAPGAGSALVESGMARYRARDLDGAEADLVQALALGAEKPGDLWIVIGHIRYEAGDIDGSLNAFRQSQAYPASQVVARDWAAFIETERSQRNR